MKADVNGDTWLKWKCSLFLFVCVDCAYHDLSCYVCYLSSQSSTKRYLPSHACFFVVSYKKYTEESIIVHLFA